MSLKIMVVDNEPITLKSMRSVAAPLGYEILTLDDSRKAAERAEKQRFDVVFVEMSMPHVDGLELTRRIRNSQLNRETAIVMFSATNDIEILRNALGEGVTFVIPKPVAPARLIPMLTAMGRPGWIKQRHSARLPLFAPVNCKWEDKQFALRSLNISETGMLLEPSIDVEEGQEVSLQFKLAEVGTTLNVRGRIVRKEGMERVGIEFCGLAREALNAIELYILGRLRGQKTPPRPLRTHPRRMFRRDE
jgi:CheY-like chemotaxis protein